jgi:hypothetical protein
MDEAQVLALRFQLKHDWQKLIKLQIAMITNISLFADDYCKPLVSLPNCVLLHFE